MADGWPRYEVSGKRGPPPSCLAMMISPSWSEAAITVPSGVIAIEWPIARRYGGTTTVLIRRPVPGSQRASTPSGSRVISVPSDANRTSAARPKWPIERWSRRRRIWPPSVPATARYAASGLTARLTTASTAPVTDPVRRPLTGSQVPYCRPTGSAGSLRVAIRPEESGSQPTPPKAGSTCRMRRAGTSQIATPSIWYAPEARNRPSGENRSEARLAVGCLRSVPICWSVARFQNWIRPS